MTFGKAYWPQILYTQECGTSNKAFRVKDSFGLAVVYQAMFSLEGAILYISHVLEACGHTYIFLPMVNTIHVLNS